MEIPSQALYHRTGLTSPLHPVRQHRPDQDQESVIPIPFLYSLPQERNPTNCSPLIPDKDKWINIERLRWSRLFSIPMLESLPPDFPAPTLPVMRALTAVYASEQNDSAQPKFTRALDALFKAHWVDGQATHRPEELKKALAEIFGAEEADKSMFCSAHQCGLLNARRGQLIDCWQLK